MRWTSAVLLVSAVSSTLVVLPTVTVPAAAARPVTADVETVPLRGIDARGLAESAAPDEDEIQGAQAPLVVSRRVPTQPFSAVGVTWAPGRAAEQVAVQVRTRAQGRWSAWTEVEVQLAAGPGDGSADTPEREGSDPLWVGPSDAVQVRVDAGRVKPRDLRLVLVDPGTSPADGRLAPTPLGGASAHAAEARPPVVSRAGWGADESLRTCTPSSSSTIKGGILHTTATANDYSASSSAAIMRSMYAYHTKSLGWCDLGYNFLVDKFGTLYEGRFGGVDKAVIGAHTGGFNTSTFGVSMIGNHDLQAPTAAMLETVRRVFAWKLGLYGLDPTGTTTYVSAGGSATTYPAGTRVTAPVISGHRDYSTKSCPGNYAYPLLPALRRSVAERISTALPPPPAAPSAPARTTLTLSGSPSSVRFGAGTTLSGRLTTADGNPLTAQPVRLYVRKRGTTAWVRLSTRTTSGTGRFSGTHKPVHNLDYQARWEGAGRAPSERTARVDVATAVTAVLSTPRVRPGGTLSLRGTVTPAHPGQTVQRQQWVNGRWTTLATTTLTGTGTFRFPITTASTGAKTYRVVKPADGDHVVGASATVVLTVR